MEVQDAIKEHYEQHLGHFYSWMTGSFEDRKNEFKKFLADNLIQSNDTKTALDLGAGHGIQSVALAEQGFDVIAVDFSEKLLSELKSNANNLPITPLNDDIRKVKQFAEKPDLIACCGDTLSHLSSKEEVEILIADIANALNDNGKVILSFRDYSVALTGTHRFIPVKSDERKILTCILDYEDDFVHVTDLLHEKINDVWHQKVSTYRKVRLTTKDVMNFLAQNKLTIAFDQTVNHLPTVIAIK
jgi:SAM-dependent methyltransferase